jgi:hypothetical protein
MRTQLLTVPPPLSRSSPEHLSGSAHCDWGRLTSNADRGKNWVGRRKRWGWLSAGEPANALLQTLRCRAQWGKNKAAAAAVAGLSSAVCCRQIRWQGKRRQRSDPLIISVVRPQKYRGTQRNSVA